MGWREFLIGSQGAANRNQWDDRDLIRNTAQAGIAAAQGRPAPQAGRAIIGQTQNVNTSLADQFRARQMGLADQLSAVASGQQAGAGELAARRAMVSGQNQALGAATMARGSGAGNAARAAARGAVGASSAGAAMAKEAAIGDQASARAGLTGLLGQGREADLQTSMANATAQNQRIFEQARLDQATSVENMRARLQAIGMNDAAIANYLQQIGAMNQGEMAARSQDNGLLGSLVGGGAAAIKTIAGLF